MVGKVYVGASVIQREALVDKLVSMLTLKQAVIDHERGGGVSGDMLSVVTAPDDWREYAAKIVNRHLREIELPDITAQQLLDLAQEYHSQSARGEEVGHAAARAPEVAAAEQARQQSRMTDEPALERGAAAVDAAVAAAERHHAAGEVSSPTARARRGRRRVISKTPTALDRAASRGTPSPTYRSACASPSA